MSRYNDTIAAIKVSESTHRAIKPHHCIHCGGTITPGQQYRRVFMLIDGKPEVYTHHQTADCNEEPWL